MVSQALFWPSHRGCVIPIMTMFVLRFLDLSSAQQWQDISEVFLR